MTPTSRTVPPRFKYWPFDIVPQSGRPLIWADRAALLKQVERLGRRLGLHEAVSLHLLWADFGAGKTHTMLYLKQQAESGKYGSILPLYCVLPKGCRSFIDIYRAIARAVPAQIIRESYQKALKASGRDGVERDLSAIWPNLPHCFQAIAVGSEIQQNIALAWFQAETGIPTRDLQGLSILGRIRLTDDAVLALTGMVTLFTLSGYRRTLLMIDEFQRVEVLRQSQQDDINAGLHGFFNACGRGMSLLLSFSFGVEANIRHFLNQELISRVDPIRISIPKLALNDGTEFLEDVIAQAREPNCAWPVSPDVVPTIARCISDRFELTPRRLLKGAGLVFEMAIMDFQDGTIPELTSDYVKRIAATDDFSRIDEQEGTN